MPRFVSDAGKYIIESATNAGYGVVMLGEALYWLRAAPKKIKEIAFQMQVCGLQSVPVVLLVGIFVGMVLALQTGLTLKTYGLQDFIAMIAGMSMTREMGPLMTAIILAGRVGSSMAAELGTMKVSEEIDALEVMSINPVKLLVMPRVIALAIMVPVLTIYVNLIGIVGAAIVGNLQIGISYDTFFKDCMDSLQLRDLYTGLFKTAVFGLIIATVGCSEGLRTSGGTQGVGESTRRAVVNSLLMILISNYLMTSIIFKIFY
jgi:phospholipid/cholesterol/gamma-HCH transport system permease protein